jgi:hypothetical protein
MFHLNFLNAWFAGLDGGIAEILVQSGSSMSPTVELLFVKK